MACETKLPIDYCIHRKEHECAVSEFAIYYSTFELRIRDVTVIRNYKQFEAKSSLARLIFALTPVPTVLFGDEKDCLLPSSVIDHHCHVRVSCGAIHSCAVGITSFLFPSSLIEYKDSFFFSFFFFLIKIIGSEMLYFVQSICLDQNHVILLIRISAKSTIFLQY